MVLYNEKLFIENEIKNKKDGNLKIQSKYIFQQANSKTLI